MARKHVTRKRPARNAALAEAREDLACALRWAVRLGLHEGICNHFSVAVPGRDDRYLINPEGIHWAELRASDLMVLDGDGKIVEGKHEVEATAFYIHSRIHKARANARCVMHTHMPFANSICATQGGRVLPISQTSLRFAYDIAYDDESGGYRGLALDEAEGDRMAAALGDKRILFLANHGVIVTGPDVAVVFDDLYYLERAAQLQVYTQMARGKPALLGDNLARDVARSIDDYRERNARLHFASLKRILAREEPEFRK